MVGRLLVKCCIIVDVRMAGYVIHQPDCTYCSATYVTQYLQPVEVEICFDINVEIGTWKLGTGCSCWKSRLKSGYDTTSRLRLKKKVEIHFETEAQVRISVSKRNSTLYRINKTLQVSVSVSYSSPTRRS